MKELKLEKWTALEEVLKWDFSRTDEVRFVVSRDASFELLAEGAFVAAIHSLQQRSGRISVGLRFQVEPLLSSSLKSDWPDFLNSLGGLALIQCADQITEFSGLDVTSRLLEKLWEGHVLPQEGAIGDGKRQCLVSRFPGAPVPKCLRKGSAIQIPARLQFEGLLQKLGTGLGAAGGISRGTFFDSITEEQVSDFLFEAFRNVMEHNTVNIPPGIWGVVLEKVLIEVGEDISARRQIPDILHDYLSTVIEERMSKKGLFLFSVTVIDYGPGIQHTLPREDAEGSWDCLMRAFQRGVSRKPKSGSPDWGQGLPNILEVIARLKAVLFVRSAEEAGMADGSTGEPVWQRVTSPQTANGEVAGTSLTIAWAAGQGNPDQGLLPLD